MARSHISSLSMILVANIRILVGLNKLPVGSAQVQDLDKFLCNVLILGFFFLLWSVLIAPTAQGCCILVEMDTWGGRDLNHGLSQVSCIQGSRTICYTILTLEMDTWEKKN